MRINRRQFIGAAGATVASAATPAAWAATPAAWGASREPLDFASLRGDFPRAVQQTYLDGAAHHPLSKHTAEGVRRYLDFQMYGPGDGRGDYVRQARAAVKPMFARLINAKASEIALVGHRNPRPVDVVREPMAQPE